MVEEGSKVEAHHPDDDTAIQLRAGVVEAWVHQAVVVAVCAQALMEVSRVGA